MAWPGGVWIGRPRRVPATILKTGLIVYTSTLCGYVFAKFRFRGRELVFGLVLVVMMRVRPDGLLPARLERRKAGGSA